MSHTHATPRYLTSKQSVDDRARSRRVRNRLLADLPENPRVVEAGSGVGNSVPTLMEWGVTPESYRGVDADADIVAFAHGFVPRVLRRRGYEVEATGGGCRVGRTPVEFERGDALNLLPEADADLLIAQSFLDLVPIEEALDAVSDALSPGGLVYAPLTFDGVTLFQPSHPADEQVLEAYHEAIDGTPGRDSRAGRHLIDRLPADELLAVDSSDWIVRSTAGGYPTDERYFLACILGFVADVVEDVDGGEEWLSIRRNQLAAGELSFVAHGYDLLWRPTE